MGKIRPPFAVNGSKFIQSKWIIDNFPEDQQEYIYVEPYCGSAGIVLNKEKSSIEVINDKDLGIIQILRALRDESSEFLKRLKMTKCKEETFNKHYEKQEEEFSDYIDQAISEFILRKMSRNGSKSKYYAFSEDEQENTDLWKESLNSLQEVSSRLKEVYIFNKDPMEIIEKFNKSNVLLCCDPDDWTDKASSMSKEDHEDLAILLNNFEGKVIMINTPSPLYKELYKDWNIDKRFSQKKKEILWKNF